VTAQWQRELRDFFLVAVYVALTGPVVGLVWSSVGPKLDLFRALGGSGMAWKVEAGADAHFGLLCLAAGVLCAAVTVACRMDGPGAVSGLAAGGLGAAFIAARVGYLLNRGDTLHLLRAHSVPLSLLSKYGIDPFFKIRALGVVVAWPLATLVVYVVALALRDQRRSLP
jgi:membrane-bound metal-dependent hydrolase YbcI (DUF457 family)